MISFDRSETVLQTLPPRVNVLHSVSNALKKSVKCRMLESTNIDRNNDHEGFSMIKRRILHSLVSLGVAVTAFSVSSNAVDLPMSYTSEDKSIVFKHTEDLPLHPR